MELDPLLLARIQFAFTISFHIIFPALSIGLASFLAVLEMLWLLTSNINFKHIYKFWVKIFAVSFGLGVVSGVVMSYQFVTIWSPFADKISNVIGPLISFEVLTAFFLEASFLGIMLFGWGRVSDKMHFAATCIVAFGTIISAFWILSANSWMHTPQGFAVLEDGRMIATDWLEVIFNPSFPHRFMHMVSAAYLATAFFVGGVAALYLLKKQNVEQAKIMLYMAVLMATFLAPMQLIIGHRHGENTMEYQPVKVAAMEGNWDKRQSAPLFLFGIPNQEEEKTEYGIEIPYGASVVLTGSMDGVIPALKDFPKDERPPVLPIFWSFRVMVGIGVLMMILGVASFIQSLRHKLWESRILQIGWVAMMPSGIIAILAGWFVTEIGRQPWTVYGVLRTTQSVSPALSGYQVGWSLLAFVLMYIFVFSAGVYYIAILIKKGVIKAQSADDYYTHSIEAAPFKSVKMKGGEDA
ncbi:MAG: cytochrome ubiquinol oxidase subunit I [Candidatus Jidaibacter sp.]|nr:cytochrome ubiquinol oxidase subunit I [Candidatus Jidaibacter sp.]